MRETWTNRSSFVLAAVGSAAGLGNAWRFPYQTAQSGGGAFLVPYFMAILVVAIPLLIFEFSIGQNYKISAPMALPKLKGSPKKLSEFFGWLTVFMAIIIVLYYSAIIAWIFNYMYYSFGAIIKSIPFWGQNSESFFYGDVLQLTDLKTQSPFQLGGFRFPLIIGMLLTWGFMWYSIRNGVNSVGSIVKYTVTLPIVLLLVLVVRSATLEGAADGFNFFLDPKFELLKDFNVWRTGFSQILYSNSVAMGIMIAYASFLNKDEDISNNAIITSLSNSVVSFIAGFAIFGTIGHMALLKGVSVAEVAGSGGIGLAFVVYPQAMLELPGGPIMIFLFSLSFFIILLTLGIDSAFSILEAVTTPISDRFGYDKKKVTLTVIVLGFLLSLFFVTRAGLYWLDVVDYYIMKLILFIASYELLLLVFGVKIKNLKEYVNKRSDIKLNYLFDIFVYIGTGILLILTVLTIGDEISSFINNKMYGDYPRSFILVAGYGSILFAVIMSVYMTLFVKKKKAVNE